MHFSAINVKRAAFAGLQRIRRLGKCLICWIYLGLFENLETNIRVWSSNFEPSWSTCMPYSLGLLVRISYSQAFAENRHTNLK